MPIASAVLWSDRDLKLNVAASRVTAARPANAGKLPSGLHPQLQDMLAQRGIKNLYSHQCAAIEQVLDGKSILVVTGTASGKSMCYSLPVFNELLSRPDARALFLFPTKALTQDQATRLMRDADAIARDDASIGIATYDGDTPQSERDYIRKQARLVLTNPDMLHAGILPHHTLWADLFSNLRFVVMDEIHVYRGVFGSNVANVIRRLKRITRHYGSHPQFIATSATIANPVEFASRLIEEPVSLIDNDGSPNFEKEFAIYNPPIVNRSLGIRRSALMEAARLVRKLLAANVQSVAFARSRRAVELLLKYLSDTLEAREGQVRGYRSGYLSGERREIERGLRDGDVRAVVATNALELGIDIGGLDAAILVGYPGSIASTRQQAGRAGREERGSLAILVATADPMDQFISRHPEYLFDRSPEQALIDPNNPLIMLQHVKCAAFEMPFQEGEHFGNVDVARVTEYLQFLVEAGILHQSGDKYFWMASHYPAEGISLRSASGETVVLESQGETIGQVDLPSSYWMVHPSAIYIHDARSYVVDALDLEKKIAHLSEVAVDYYTEPRSESTVQLLSKQDEAETRGAIKASGEIAVTSQVVGFRKTRLFTNENLGEGEVSLPPTELHTTAYWFVVKESTVESLRATGNWSNDQNDYGPRWDQIRKLVRARDHFKCQNCGRPEDGRAHDVHHKIPFRSFPSYEQANVLDNLVTLCGICHGLAEAAVRLKSGLAGAAYAIGHLAPLFVMCDSRDLGVHSDPNSTLAEAQPAIVIYDTIPGGIGLSERLYDLHDELVSKTLSLVAECPCDSGCPSCVGPGGESGSGGKREALALLTKLAPETVMAA